MSDEINDCVKCLSRPSFKGSHHDPPSDLCYPCYKGRRRPADREWSDDISDVTHSMIGE